VTVYWYVTPWLPHHIAKNGDLQLYRTYVVYSRSWKIIVPPGVAYSASARKAISRLSCLPKLIEHTVLGLLVQIAPFTPGLHIQRKLNVAFMCTTIIYNAYAGVALFRKLNFFTRLTGRQTHRKITNIETRARLVQLLIFGSTVLYILFGVLPLVIPHQNKVASMFGLLFQIMTVCPSFRLNGLN
jgi:hypothetical protein